MLLKLGGVNKRSIMTKIPNKQGGGKLPVTGTQYDKSKAMRKRIAKLAKLAESKFKAGPPKSKVKMQSEKVIPRRPARKMSFNAVM